MNGNRGLLKLNNNRYARVLEDYDGNTGKFLQARINGIQLGTEWKTQVEDLLPATGEDVQLILQSYKDSLTADELGFSHPDILFYNPFITEEVTEVKQTFDWGLTYARQEIKEGLFNLINRATNQVVFTGSVDETWEYLQKIDPRFQNIFWLAPKE